MGKAAAQDAAQDDVNTQFPILESQAQATIQQANQHFLNEKTRIDAIKASDTEYLNDEISTVDEVQRILSQLNSQQLVLAGGSHPEHDGACRGQFRVRWPFCDGER